MTEITEQIPYENEELLNINIHQCVVANYNNLSEIYRSKFDISKPLPNELRKTYAKPFIFYHHTEDTDHLSKIKELPGILHDTAHRTVTDHYTDDGAETEYLNSNPVSYLIVGKPEIGQTELAHLIADHWKCVQISPDSVLKEEVMNDTRAGKCIKYNLEAGRSIGPEVILRLVEKRIKSQSAQHRGFVLSGFPMLKNELFQEDPISSESAVFNVQEIFEDMLPGEPVPDKPGSVSLVVQSELASTITTKDDKDENKSEGTLSDEIKGPKSVKFPTKKKNLGDIHLSRDLDLGNSDTTIVTHSEPFHSLKDPNEQLSFLQNLFGTPLVIIYLMCGALDVRSKREKYRYNVYLQKEIFSNPYLDEYTTENSPQNISLFEDDLYFAPPEVSDYKIDGSTMKMQVILPMHFRKSISSQLWQYKCHVHANIKKQIMEHNSQYFIKVDGRLSAADMFRNINDRMRMLAFQPVLIPERFHDEDDFGEFATDIQTPAEPQPPEFSFHNLRGKMTVGPMFKYQLSNWAFKCPVALKEGRIITGKTEYAVKFMSKLFFLSSEDALIKFYRNPRPYLLPIMPNPTCRIWIIGPKCSGKSVVAKCLSFLFNCKILDPTELENFDIKRKETEYLDKIRTAAITEALVQLNENRQKEKIAQIEEWITIHSELLQRAYDFKIEHTQEKTPETFKDKKKDRKPETPKGKRKTAKELEEEKQKKLEEERQKKLEEEQKKLEEEQIALSKIEIEEALQQVGLPSMSNTNLIQQLLKDRSALLEYLPAELKAPVEPATVFDHYVLEYVDDIVNTAPIPNMSLTIEEKVDMFKTEIDRAEEEYNQIFQKLGGWIIDDMSTEVEVLQKLFPHYIADDIICLKDEESDHDFLTTKFAKKDFNTFKDYKQVFKKLNMPSMVEIKSSVMSVASKYHFIDSVVSEVEDRVISSVESTSTVETLTQDKNKMYEDHLNEFIEKWEKVKTFLKDHAITPIEINIEYKTMHDLLKNTVIALENRYRKVAEVMTEEQKEEEQVDFAEPNNEGFEDMAGEGDGGDNINFFNNNRRLGYTNMYCPVTFDRYFVLWKGKEEFAAYFEQQVYLLSSKAAMNEFVTNPRLFLKNDSPELFPPARICVIGIPGGGKTTLAIKLAENYGLHYINYDSLILDILNLPTNYDLEQIFRIDPTMNPVLLNHVSDIEMIKHYIERDAPLSNNIVSILLSRFWHEEPYKNDGFVLDNFPKRPSDVLAMISNYLIPDIVIELITNEEEASTRIMPIRFDQYRSEVIEKKRIKDLENEKIHNKWHEEKVERLQTLAQDKREQRKIQAYEQYIENKRLLTTPVQSEVSLERIEELLEKEVAVIGKGGGEEEEEIVIEEEEIKEEEEEWFIYDDEMEIEDLFEINKILEEEMPEPIFNDIWETEDETRERILTEFSGDYNINIDFIDTIRKMLLEENIDCTILSSDSIDQEKILFEIIRLVDHFKFRNRSLFERVYEVNLDVAERLLDQGYYFISKFGRTCPVQVFENTNPIQMFLPGESKNIIFTLIYKRYIYFIYEEESRDKFKYDPLKYVLNTDYKFPLIPFRISIIGPPKSGKTTLANRFGKEFQMKIISRGTAVREVLKEMPNFELAKNISYILKKGWSVTQEMIAKSVETLAMYSESLSQGYIMDGFPNNQQEINHFRYLGIIPHMFIDVQTSMTKIKEYTAANIDRPPFPTYSFDYIKHLWDEWERNAHVFRNFIYKEYENMYQVENLDSKWHLWNQARKIMFSKGKAFQDYIKKREYDIALVVKTLCVTPNEFFTCQSVFLNYCALCYYYDDYLSECGASPDRNYVFQYRNEYFYICETHKDKFIANPKIYVPPINEKLLPNDLPKIVVSKISESAYEDGFCIVSFWDHQPKYVLLKGDGNYTVFYKGMYYIFCDEYCMKKFMATPDIYYNKIIHYKNPNTLDLCELKKLPTLGYLEQLAAKILINAVINVEMRRPYFVGLSISKSAAIHIAIYLKLQNHKTPKMIIPLYNEARERLDERRKKLKNYITYFKGRLNPFIQYTERYVQKQVSSEEEKPTTANFDIKKWMYDRMPEPEYE